MKAVSEKPVAVFFDLEGWEEPYLREQLPEVEVRATSDLLLPGRVGPTADADIVSVFIMSRVTADVMAAMPDLRFVATRSTGFDHVDLAAAKARGIQVANVPYYGENTVAEHTMALILSLSRNVHRAYVRTVAGNYSLEGLRGFDLQGKRLGIIGAGSIGLHVIRMAKGFGMEVVASDLRQNRLIADVLGFEYVDLDTLLATSDVISLHLPYSAGARHLLDRERLAKVKRGALLINTARGQLVDTDGLLWALDAGILGGAGLDVFEGEDMVNREEQLLATDTGAEEQLKAAMRLHLLQRRENVVLTPHIAFNSHEAVRRILDTTVGNIRAFLAGQPTNLVGA
ncbi:MAG: hydroxyacid dehydrogenase [Chloroflexi bacterium]|nr:hydroxyacid dehydrogenase [Chloroflexota bacterium]